MLSSAFLLLFFAFVANGLESDQASFQYNGKSYYVSLDHKAKYMEAAYICQTRHDMTLATIDLAEENDAIEKYLKNAGVEGRWWTAGNRLLRKDWTWNANGQHIEYTKWETNKPGNEKCLGVTYSTQKGLLWSDVSCSDELYYICEKVEQKLRLKRQTETDKIDENEDKDDETDEDEDEEELEAASDEDWKEALELSPPGFITYTYNEGKKFHVETDMLGTHTQAQEFCKYHDMQLVAIESERENNITQKILEDIGDEGPFWIGGRKPLKFYRWVGVNKAITYTNLAAEEKLIYEEKTCLLMFLEGEWKLEKCGYVRPFICEVAEEPLPDAEETADEKPPHCPVQNS